jgi:hypothetical protein
VGGFRERVQKRLAKELGEVSDVGVVIGVFGVEGVVGEDEEEMLMFRGKWKEGGAIGLA